MTDLKLNELNKDHKNYKLQLASFPKGRKFSVWINEVGMPHLCNPNDKNLNCRAYHQLLIKSGYTDCTIVVLTGSTTWEPVAKKIVVEAETVEVKK